MIVLTGIIILLHSVVMAALFGIIVVKTLGLLDDHYDQLFHIFQIYSGVCVLLYDLSNPKICMETEVSDKQLAIITVIDFKDPE